MPLDPSTFEYAKPTDVQMDRMTRLRKAVKEYAEILEYELAEGSDKTYSLRKLREVAMWANIAITRMPDGSPRKD